MTSTCNVEGCDKVAVRLKFTICEMHYMRQKRHDSFEATQKIPTLTDTGYMTCYNKAHPIASKSGYLFEHRRILWESIGPGTHQCYWCGSDVTWGATGKEKLVVDHLDGVKTNNDISNLKAACQPCNGSRGFLESWLRTPDKRQALLKMLSSLM